MMTYKLSIGIDVDKLSLNYVSYQGSQNWSSFRKQKVAQLPNTVNSIDQFLASYTPHDCLFVFEPTGSYSDKLKQLLLAHGHQFSLVNPAQSHHFSQFLGISNKSDAHSARMLAMMGGSMELALYKAPNPELEERKRSLSVLYGLLKQERMLKNQLEAQQQYYHSLPELTDSLEALLALYQQQIEQIKQGLKEKQSEQYLQTKELVMSVKGIGPVTADWLLSLTGSLEHFDKAKQLVKFCGLAPGKQESGTSVKKKIGVSKNASALFRASLFMGARSAIRHNLACKELYQRLRAKGKNFYQAIVAVMAKLVKQIFGVVKSGIPFDNQYYLKFQKN